MIRRERERERNIEREANEEAPRVTLPSHRTVICRDNVFRFNEQPAPTAKMSSLIMQMFDRRQTRDIAIVSTNGEIKETVAK